MKPNIGLKQGCAALSDLSFVLVKNSNQISFGFIAKSLQHEEGCYLPSFVFDQSKDVVSNLRSILSRKDLSNVANCVTEYGFGDFDKGIDMLVNHINQMKDNKDWDQHEYVFKLVITDVKQNNESSGDSNKDAIQIETNGGFESTHEEDTLTSVVSSVIVSSVTRRSPSSKRNHSKNKVSPFKSMMEEVFKELPRYYIHIPDDFHIKINEEEVLFNFWQKRLVSLMRFDQSISKNESFRDQDDVQRIPSNNYMKVRIFCGFDPIRVDETEQRAASLYMYSRKSGRLIKHEPDARNMLKITSGGTDFCQGLTCIVDDVDGHIPLNPTKQDVAFSDMENGDILKENLYAWVSAHVSIYYKYHKDKTFDGSKKDLTSALIDLTKKVKKTFSGNSSSLCEGRNSSKPLAYADFLTLSNVIFTRPNKKDKILVYMTNKIKEAGTGADTLFKLRGTVMKSAKKQSPKTKKSTPNKKKATPKKRKSTVLEDIPKPEPLRSTKRARNKVQYAENTSDIDEFDIDSLDEVTRVQSSNFVVSDNEDIAITRSKSQRSRRKLKATLEAETETDRSDEVYSAKVNQGDNQDIADTRAKCQTPKRKSQATLEAEDEMESLRKKLEHAENVIAKQSYDYKKLLDVKTMLQNENQRIFDEVEYLQTQQELLNTQGNETHDANNYAMLMEVKNNIQDENDRLTEELGFCKNISNKLQADNEYLNKKQEVMQKKLDAERSLRMAAEEEIKALEKKAEANGI